MNNYFEMNTARMFELVEKLKPLMSHYKYYDFMDAIAVAAFDIARSVEYTSPAASDAWNELGNLVGDLRENGPDYAGRKNK